MFVPVDPDGRPLTACRISSVIEETTRKDWAEHRNGPLSFVGIPEGRYQILYECNNRLFVAGSIPIRREDECVVISDLTRGDRIQFRWGIPLGLHVAFRSGSPPPGFVPWARVIELMTGKSQTVATPDLKKVALSVKPGYYLLMAHASRKKPCMVLMRVHRSYAKIEMENPESCKVLHTDGLSIENRAPK